MTAWSDLLTVISSQYVYCQEIAGISEKQVLQKKDGSYFILNDEMLVYSTPGCIWSLQRHNISSRGRNAAGERGIKNGIYYAVCCSYCSCHLFMLRIYNKAQHIIYSKQVYTAHYGDYRSYTEYLDQRLEIQPGNSAGRSGQRACQYRFLWADKKYRK